jgi:hypothetical protein
MNFTTLWTIKLSDWQRGLVVAILTTPLTIIYDTVTATPMTGANGKLLTNK